MLKTTCRYLSALALLSSTLLVDSGAAKQDKCRALVLSGGANKGAYEAGVIYGFT